MRASRLIALICCAAFPVTTTSCGGESGSASSTDCDVVAGLVPEFLAMDGRDAVGGLVTARFADRVRAAAQSVSGSQVRDELNTWADGFGLLADLQRRGATAPAGVIEDRNRVLEAGDAIYGTAAALRRTCPDDWPAGH